MRLVHYSRTPLENIRDTETQINHWKPSGLWVSDDDCEDNWRSWCESEEFALYCFRYANVVHLKKDANILFVTSKQELLNLNMRVQCSGESHFIVEWSGVSKEYDGIIITPHFRQLRFDIGWYSTWDCASGCIWRSRAIERIETSKIY